jgi:hypothetical protein
LLAIDKHLVEILGSIAGVGFFLGFGKKNFPEPQQICKTEFLESNFNHGEKASSQISMLKGIIPIS